MIDYKVLNTDMETVLDMSRTNGYIVSIAEQVGDTVTVGSSPIAGGVGATVTTMGIPSKNLDFVGAVAYGNRQKKQALVSALYPRREVIIRATADDGAMYDAHGYVAISPAFNGYGFAFSIFCDTAAWEDISMTEKQHPAGGLFVTDCSLPVDFTIRATLPKKGTVKMQAWSKGSSIIGVASVNAPFLNAGDQFEIYKTKNEWYIRSVKEQSVTTKMEYEGYVKRLAPESYLYLTIDDEQIPCTVTYRKAWGSVI